MKQKASVRFAITASVIATFTEPLSQTQRKETKYQREKEIRYEGLMSASRNIHNNPAH